MITHSHFHMFAVSLLMYILDQNKMKTLTILEGQVPSLDPSPSPEGSWLCGGKNSRQSQTKD